MDELNRKSVNEFREAQKMPIVVVLDNIRSMHNVGSVFRTADAFLIECIYLCGYTPRPPHRDIHKTALGATETVQWQYTATTVEAVAGLLEQQYNIWAVEQTEGSVPLNDIPVQKLVQPTGQQRIAVVFGNEVSGVEDNVLRLCHGCIEIPQAGMKHSLNISVAAGIVLWELFQKTTVPAR
ncbi:MAG: RNA methyltransferase [Chitinophagaceae bacterium]|nr:RNA methyltransferase [Chitinophagaceae bacterium]